MKSFQKVVILWRPDTFKPGIPVQITGITAKLKLGLDGIWCHDSRVFIKDKLPLEYAGQETWPTIPYFVSAEEAITYLSHSRDHTACQLALEAFQARWKNISLTIMLTGP